MRDRLWCGVVLLAMLLPAEGLPQDGGGRSALLKARLTSVHVRKRSDAPMLVEVEFDHAGTRLLEGFLELTFSNAYGSAPAVVAGPDIALTNGVQTVRMMLPAMSSYAGPVAAQMRFIMRDKALELGTAQIMAPDSVTRSFVIAVVEAMERADPDPEIQAVAQALRLEHFDPETHPPNTERPVVTSSVFLPPDDAPVAPLAFCQYDMVLLAGDAFAAVRERSLQALERWVLAGGSVCVLPEEGLRDYHMRFLNALAGSDVFETDASGRITTADSGARVYHAGLGRAAILLRRPDPEKDFDAPEWRSVVAFLWKVRAGKQLETILSTGKWSAALQEEYEGLEGYYDLTYRQGSSAPVPALPFSTRPVRLTSVQGLVQSLMPTTIRVAPISLMCAILIGFVALVGPGDYIVLGRLKRHKYTWALLPVVCILFTVLFVMISRYYMGAKDYRQHVDVVDIGPGGVVYRANRFEMIFSAGEQTVATQLDQAIFADAGVGMDARFGAMRRASADADSRMVYTGRFPTTCEVRQLVRQWTPQINRLFSISRKPSDEMRSDATYQRIVSFLDGLDPSGIADADHVRLALIAIPGIPRDAACFLVTGLPDTRQFYSPANIADPASFLKEVSAFPQVGLLSIVAQLSPNGASALEDLPIMDQDDRRQVLVGVVLHHGDHLTVYRRLYHTKTGT